MFAAHGVLLPTLLSANAKTAYVSTSEGTTSTSYTDLTTTTDTVTVTVGSSGMVLVLINCGVNGAADINATSYVSYDISGATTRSPSDDKGFQVFYCKPTYGSGFLETGLAEGSTTFKLKYRSSTNVFSMVFDRRRVTVVPL